MVARRDGRRYSFSTAVPMSSTGGGEIQSSALDEWCRGSDDLMPSDRVPAAGSPRRHWSSGSDRRVTTSSAPFQPFPGAFNHACLGFCRDASKNELSRRVVRLGDVIRHTPRCWSLSASPDHSVTSAYPTVTGNA